MHLRPKGPAAPQRLEERVIGACVGPEALGHHEVEGLQRRLPLPAPLQGRDEQGVGDHVWSAPHARLHSLKELHCLLPLPGCKGAQVGEGEGRFFVFRCSGPSSRCVRREGMGLQGTRGAVRVDEASWDVCLCTNEGWAGGWEGVAASTCAMQEPQRPPPSHSAAQTPLTLTARGYETVIRNYVGRAALGLHLLKELQGYVEAPGALAGCGGGRGVGEKGRGGGRVGEQPQAVHGWVCMGVGVDVCAGVQPCWCIAEGERQATSPLLLHRL
jgi:hypothetical protein